MPGCEFGLPPTYVCLYHCSLLPDGYLFFAPIINWGKYREENGRLLMPVSVRLNHAIADGYLVANVYRLLEMEMDAFVKR